MRSLSPAQLPLFKFHHVMPPSYRRVQPFAYVKIIAVALSGEFVPNY
jgi:hypothetical protein